MQCGNHMRCAQESKSSFLVFPTMSRAKLYPAHLVPELRCGGPKAGLLQFWGVFLGWLSRPDLYRTGPYTPHSRSESGLWRTPGQWIPKATWGREQAGLLEPFIAQAPKSRPLSALLKVLQKSNARGTSLVAQWLRICFVMHRTWVQSLVRELRSHMP